MAGAGGGDAAMVSPDQSDDEDLCGGAAGSSSDEGAEAEARPIRIPLGHPPLVLALPGSQQLADRVMAHLGWKLGACKFATFPNGEISLQVLCNVANQDVFIICARDDLEVEVNRSLISKKKTGTNMNLRRFPSSILTLLLFLDAVRGESPHRITVILPCLEYARQDRRIVAGEGLPPKLMLRCMQAAGANRFLTVDLHNGAEASFCPRGTILDELSADKYLVHFVRQHVPECYHEKMFVCATVGGGLPYARHIASVLGCFFGMCDRFRARAGENRGEVRVISDSNIQEAEAVVVIDDMVDTGGSFVEAVAAVRSAAPGAKLYGLAAHGYFSGEAHLEIRNSVQKCGLEWLAVTNTVSQVSMQRRLSSVGMEDRLKVVDISRLVAGAIVRIHLGESVNSRTFRSLTPSERDTCLPTLEGGTLAEQPHLGLSSSKEEVTD